MQPTSVLLVPVIDADPTISAFRQRLDPTERQGMPPHVTLVVPFMPPGLIDETVTAALSKLFSRFEPFDFSLSTVAWFDRRVVYLAPAPPDPFRALVHAVVQDFPDYPPYEGAFDDVVPHVTVGEGGRWRKRSRQMRRAAAEVGPVLPILSRAEEVWLMVHPGQAGRWERVQTFALGAAAWQ